MNKLECHIDPVFYKWVLSVYNQIFLLFKDFLWISEEIVGLERGLILKNGNRMFWDYLEETHGNIEEANEYIHGIRCIKLILSSWKEFVFSHHSSDEARNEGILCLDDVFVKLNADDKKKADALLNQLVQLESQYFMSKKQQIKNKMDCEIMRTFWMRKGLWD